MSEVATADYLAYCTGQALLRLGIAGLELAHEVFEVLLPSPNPTLYELFQSPFERSQ